MKLIYGILFLAFLNIQGMEKEDKTSIKEVSTESDAKKNEEKEKMLAELKEICEDLKIQLTDPNMSDEKRALAGLALLQFGLSMVVPTNK